MAAPFSMEAVPQFMTRQALLVLNLQEDFVSPKGKIPVVRPTDYIDRIKQLVRAFRDAGDVIWVRTEFQAERTVNDPEGLAESVVTDDDVAAHERDGPDSAPATPVEAPQPSLAGSKSATSSAPAPAATSNETFLSEAGADEPRCCERNTAGAAFAAEVAKDVNETVDHMYVTSYYSAFNSTDLLSFLRGNFVTELYVCGLISNVSVYATALDAVRHGYCMTLVEDCLGYRSAARHAEAVRQMTEFMGAEVIESRELVRLVSQTRPAARPDAGVPADQAILEAFRTGAASGQRPMETRSMDSAIGLFDDPSESTSTQQPAGKKDSRRPSPAGKGSAHKVERPLAIRSQHPSSEDLAIQPSKRPPPRLLAQENDEEEKAEETRSGAATAAVGDGAEEGAASSSSTTPTTVVAEQATITAASTQAAPRPRVRRPIQASSASALATEADIGEGDSRIVHDVLSPRLRHGVFERLQDEVRFRAMFHRGGEVPRLVAVQGEIAEDGSLPVYRHPADECPPLSRFSPVVSKIREEVQKVLGHPVNHVLIQYYRDGQDYISEHSDKSLDIVRGSNIANVSIGAQRTMLLRTKKSANAQGEALSNASRESREGQDTEQGSSRPRRAQRIPMPHNSMFVLGPQTNMRWLHGIRPDKRAAAERSTDELAYGGERISLTFRRIGTFLNPRSNLIWGQGAKSKKKDDAGPIAEGGTPEAERMVNAFGRENQETEFDWEAVYGAGFDALDIMPNRPKLLLSHHSLSNAQVRMHLAEIELQYDVREPGSFDGISRPSPRPLASHDDGGTRFVDNDIERSETVGVLPIMFYLEKYYREGGGTFGSAHTRSEVATIVSRCGQTHQLIRCWERFCQVTTLPRPASSSSASSSFSSATTSASCTNADRLAAEKALHRELATWEDRAGRFDFLGCDAYSVADAAFWPVLHDIVIKWADWDIEVFAHLHRYHDLLLKRPCVRTILPSPPPPPPPASEKEGSSAPPSASENSGSASTGNEKPKEKE